jgi:hypothetical protein
LVRVTIDQDWEAITTVWHTVPWLLVVPAVLVREVSMAAVKEVERELSFGEKAVGLTFNPSGDPKVNEMKQLYARIIDLMDQQRIVANQMDEHERVRLFSVAVTEAQGAQMWAVKAITWRV